MHVFVALGLLVGGSFAILILVYGISAWWSTRSHRPRYRYGHPIRMGKYRWSKQADSSDPDYASSVVYFDSGGSSDSGGGDSGGSCDGGGSDC